MHSHHDGINEIKQMKSISQSKLYQYFAIVVPVVMTAPTNIIHLLIYLGLGSVFYIGINALKIEKLQRTFTMQRIVSLLLALCIMGVSLFIFIQGWKVSSIVTTVAGLLHVRTYVLLFMMGALFFVLFGYGVYSAISQLMIYLQNCCRFNRVGALSLVISALLQWIQLEYSTDLGFHTIFAIHQGFIIVNFMAVLCFVGLLTIALKKNYIVGIGLTSLLSTIWSIVNYFTIKYHGSPLFFSEFYQIKTAFDVLSGYSFKVDGTVLMLILFCIPSLFFCVVLYLEKKTRGLNVTRGGMAVISTGMLCYIVLIYINPDIRPKNVMTGSWKYGVEEYGYISCIFEDINKRINPIEKPADYSLQEINSYQRIVQSVDQTSEQKPDIILILNESFYDFSIYLDIQADTDYLEPFSSLENVHYGYAIQPSLGGGTNNTEFELLTSNSMALLPISAPFTYLDFAGNVNSIASYYQSQGYQTVAMHCAGKSNYSRNRIYPQIGFDTVILEQDDFTFSQYGNRKWLDSDNYHDLINLYNSMDSDPRFMYLLTYQNHGSWDQNDSIYDKVHIQNDFGDNTDRINEYLTSIYISGQAFSDLVEELKNSERPIILCVLGDHAPSMISELEDYSSWSGDDKKVRSHAVPYAVWSNMDNFEWSDENEWLTVTDFLPLVKESYGAPLSTYDEYILNLHHVAPIRMTDGLCVLQDGSYIRYNPTGEKETDKLYRRYLFCEYNLLSKQGYRSELFQYSD